MKPILLPSLALACCLAGSLPAQQQSARPDDFLPDKPPAAAADNGPKMKLTLLLPEEKTAEPVKPVERNPFGKSSEELLNLNGKATTEENSIRERLEKLRIVGASPGPKGLRVMLGDMVLEEGQNVPSVLADQTLALRVGHITNHFIELVWVEKKSSGLPPRLLTLTVDLRPYVRYALQGQPSDRPPDKVASRNANVAIGTEFLDETPENTAAAKSGPDASTAATADKNTTAAGKATPPATGSDSSVADSSKDPDVWKRAVGFLNDLVKLEEVKK